MREVFEQEQGEHCSSQPRRLMGRDKGAEHSRYNPGTCKLAQTNEVQYGALAPCEDDVREVSGDPGDLSMVHGRFGFEISDFGSEISNPRFRNRLVTQSRNRGLEISDPK